jgi:hypothetical protein
MPSIMANLGLKRETKVRTKLSLQVLTNCGIGIARQPRKKLQTKKSGEGGEIEENGKKSKNFQVQFECAY